jgi:hypothetical protein
MGRHLFTSLLASDLTRADPQGAGQITCNVSGWGWMYCMRVDDFSGNYWTGILGVSYYFHLYALLPL